MRFSAWLVAGISLGACGVHAQQYPAPSFDCANITMPQELLICRSSQLSELDGRHGDLAARAIRASPNPERTRSDVEAWINHVRNVCETDRCLADAYAVRIAELERSVAPLAPAAPLPQPVAPAVQAAVSAKPEIEKPAPSAKGPVPEPQSSAEEEDDDDDSRPWYLVAAVIAAGAVVIAAIMKVSGTTFR